jgi:hypothetical protein
MSLPKYDKVLLTGSDAELNEYIDKSGQCLVVDWRSEEGDLINALAKLIPEARLTYGWGKGRCGEDDIFVSFRGRRYKLGLTMSGRDRYITLRRLNEILAGEYELREFRHTLGDDTHSFYPKPCSWWAAMERAFPAAIERVFSRITADMDFPDYK